MSALIGNSSNPNPRLIEGLRQSSVRWLEHAATLVDDHMIVVDGYLEASEPYDRIIADDRDDPASVRERLRSELQVCEQAEDATFGSTYLTIKP